MTRLKSAWLLLTNQCNLRCEYCWLTKYGSKIEPRSMSIDTANSSIEFLKRNGIENFTITFFGGEPLLEFETIKSIMNTHPMLSYAIFTNSVLLDENKIEFFYNRRDFVEITVSIDGVENTNLASRGFKYDENVIRKVFNLFPSARVRYTVLDPTGCYDGIKHLYSIGARKISVTIPHFMDNGPEYYRVFNEERLKIKSDYVINSVTEINSNEDRTICKAGLEYVAIDPCGDIYPCDLFYWLGKNKLGNVFNGMSEALVGDYVKQLAEEKDICSGCAAELLYCKEIAIRNDKNISSQNKKPT